MMPDQYQEYIELIKNGIAKKSYADITLSVHTIKANLRYFIEVSHPVIEFCQNFENRAREKSDEFKKLGDDMEHVDFSSDFEKLVQITEEPLQEIQLYGFELKERIAE
jgi:hypothetical protein